MEISNRLAVCDYQFTKHMVVLFKVMAMYPKLCVHKIVSKNMNRSWLAAAKKLITIHWLDVHPPTYLQWLKKVKEIRDMERLTYLVRLQNDHSIKKWTPFVCLKL